MPPRAAIPIPPLAGPGDTLVHAGAARSRPFLLATAGCGLRGTETRGIEAVEREGQLLLAGVSVVGAGCGNVLLAPAQARRELVTPSGTLIETLLVSGAGLIGQWARPTATSGGNDLLLLVPGASARADGPFLRVDGADGVRLLQITPPPSWRVEESAGLDGFVRVLATLRVDQDGTRLAATLGRDLAVAEAQLRRLALVREARAESELSELRTRRLAMHTGVEELDDGLAWAIARLEAALGGGAVHELAAGEPFPLDPDARRAWTGLGALVGGRPGPLELDAATPLGALALARTATLRGRRLDPTDLPALADPAADALDAGDAARRAARRGALREAADALEPWLGRARAEELRARASALATASPAPAGRMGLRLPTLGGGVPGEDAFAAALTAALDLPGHPPFRPPPEDPPHGVARALTAWACLNDGALERGFALFRTHLADGFAQGVGLWPDGERVHDAAAAALVPLVLAHGLLGLRADAYYGRLRLSPRLPEHWNRLTVTGIPIGDATVRMEYERAGVGHRFRFAQESGAVPVMLVLEPLLTVGPDARPRVDGAPAALAVSAPRADTGGRAQVKVQLPLDRERELSLG